MTLRHVRPLLSGPIDVVGDVHGEIDALSALLRVLGYDRHGDHPQGRRLVFVGDLCDRGPDSVGVIGLVRTLVARESAQCVLGNHELNVLRGARKEGNGWFFAEDHDAKHSKFRDVRRATAAERATTLEFFAALPIALERADLRVTHAAWDDSAVLRLRDEARGVLDTYQHYATQLDAAARESGLAAKADAEEARHYEAITDPSASVPLLEHSARQDALYQMGNPLRVLTSGHERPSATPFFATGKWRMVERVKWWDDYAHATPVIFGHYWRWPGATDYGVFGTWKQDLFADTPPHAWCGQQRRAFCVDFSVGARFHERLAATYDGFRTRLGAVRWPEQLLVTDDGVMREIV
jgi:hypothetical protein